MSTQASWGLACQQPQHTQAVPGPAEIPFPASQNLLSQGPPSSGPHKPWDSRPLAGRNVGTPSEEGPTEGLLPLLSGGNRRALVFWSQSSHSIPMFGGSGEQPGARARRPKYWATSRHGPWPEAKSAGGHQQLPPASAGILKSGGPLSGPRLGQMTEVLLSNEPQGLLPPSALLSHWGRLVSDQGHEPLLQTASGSFPLLAGVYTGPCKGQQMTPSTVSLEFQGLGGSPQQHSVLFRRKAGELNDPRVSTWTDRTHTSTWTHPCPSVNPICPQTSALGSKTAGRETFR